MRKIYFASGIVCAALFSACSDFDFDEHRGVFKSEEYDANFEKMVGGEVHPAQDWGFGSSGTRVAEPQGADNPGNLGLVQPKDITEKEKAWVMNWFATHPGGPSQTLDLKNYFVQQVGAGNQYDQGVQYQVKGKVWEKYENNQHVYREENATINSKEHMDWLASNLKANPADPSVDCDHIERFNAASGKIMYMKDSETQYGFTFQDSYGTVNNYVTDGYYMVYLYNEENEVDGWYVGFDYRFSKVSYGVQYWNGTENVYDETIAASTFMLEPDGYYNDWVVKIVPGNGETPKPGDGEEDYIIGSWRIFGEDLGTTDDFDFNDVVFDVHIYNSGKAVIDLLAAGGTIPLYVGNRDYEVHEKFGVAVDCMVNTGASNGVKKPIVTYTLEGNYTRPSEIDIIVDHGNFTYVLEAEKGKAPQKIAVSHETDPNVKWPAERQNITDAYPGFSDYATKKASNWTANPNSAYLY